MIRTAQTSPAPAADVRDIDLDPSEIKLDQSAQPREALNNDRIAEYAEAMKAGDQFPPLTVFHDGSTYWLADGFHRHYAAQHAGRKHIRCYVRQGGLRDAILWSVGANAKHGLARSDEDKRRAVMRLLADEEWSDWSDREIARRCRVSDKFVAKQRPAVSADRPQIERKVQRGGTVYTQKVAKAAKTNAPEALVNDEPSPEVGPQAEASHCQDTGVGMLADREGRREGEAASVDLPTIPVLGRRDPLDPVLWQVMQLRAAWAKANDEARAIFLAEIQSSDGMASGSEHPCADHVSPPASQAEMGGGSANEGGDHVIPPYLPAYNSGNASLAAREGEKPLHSNSNSSASSRQTDKAGDVAPPASPATPRKPLRPHCLNPDLCAGSGREHCHACKKAMASAEVAA
ncbi:hypothetical protein FJ981_27925 [Mesorhizobium sp. B1-1-4]|uniref:ParB/RepB/Spo0J family partition protein n=1 Tax=Mesorhizobium sp. B1-1-4 TaxID=2589980 RepID=UPI001127690B|nr:ParB/RepB/Spo0J family partition protein [Mesorhizobium sp. B1-1-4]TPN44428.1 hypothetical protein FJ981_27925 [Mesorhizobium sp. B1-1-4]